MAPNTIFRSTLFLIKGVVFFAGLLRSYNSSHPDYQSANMAMIKLQTIIRKMANRIHESVRCVICIILIKNHPLVTKIDIIAGKLYQNGRDPARPGLLLRGGTAVRARKGVHPRRLSQKTFTEGISAADVLSGE